VSSASGFFGSRTKPASARLRLFCLPNAGGGVALLHAWLRGLPPQVDLCPIQLPGRESRRMEKSYVRMETLVGALAEAIQPWLDIPFAFFGHSLGALVSFELVRELRRRNMASPAQLFVSARPAPQFHRSLRPMHQLPEPEFIAELIKRYDAIPAAILADPELMQLFLPILRADLEIMETYVYQAEPPLQNPISVFGGLQDRTVGADHLEAWKQQTSNSFRLRMFPGDHFFPRNARTELLEAITEDLSLWTRDD
jgi:medium-chain acyl-[acyl-carrier-protein] hydrolase